MTTHPNARASVSEVEEEEQSEFLCVAIVIAALMCVRDCLNMRAYTINVYYHSFTYNNVHVLWCEFGGCSVDAICEVSVKRYW